MASSSFTFPPKRGSPASATRGTNRPAPQRTHSAGSRSTPYSRPPPLPAAAPSTSAADGKWQHDLFGEKSDLYRPKINTAALLARAGVDLSSSSASLRPFGNATPAAQPILHAPSNGPQLGAINARAMGIKGQNAAQQQQQLQRQQQRQAEIAARKERAEAARQRKVLEDQRRRTLDIAQHEQQGFVVQVEGLVSGTSAEDVQAAFGAYGEIVYCIVPDPDAADLVARLTFSRHADAADACAKLNGAIADGRPLGVKQVDRTPIPPALPPLAPPKLQPSTLAPSPFPSSASFSSSPSATSGPFAGVPTGPRAQRRQPAPAPPRIALPTVVPSKMYADQVEEAQLEALGGAGDAMMDVDMATAPAAAAAAAVASAPGRGAGGRGGGRGGRAGGGGRGGHVQQQPQQQQQLSLAARLSGAGQPKGQRQPQQQQQGKAHKPAQQQPVGLAARLGAAAAQGKAAGRAGPQGGGGSLLSRLA
ncbi:uncharacterized protein RHOBADRAFT_50742 [Rhodotorula graminis WP1]|uniref:RRM domain-containing protein n=1 Tax=Rhodotorula graminis (strain WP1) TaxID=578459 RepID=A0A194SCC2_RHOGW|nr:uncharacterized protein RHOBADRAFT_50742 [Rhodotorula graminis WP1]KPV78252.1 hypothetical protein RHOBADRAFT_50742 [Rhodotorula graminis WP1]